MTQGTERKDTKMSTKKNTFARKALASVGAAALGLMGVIGLSATAMADESEPTTPPPPSYGNIDKNAIGSLEIHKLVGDKEGSTPLGGVEFTITPCLSFDINNPDDWAALVGPFSDEKPVAGACADLGEEDSKTTGPDGIAKFPSLEVGAYLVTETAKPGNVTTTVKPFWVTIPYPANNIDPYEDAFGWVYNVVVYPKNEIKGAGSKTADLVTGLELGAIVDWTLTSPVLGFAGTEATEDDPAVAGLPAGSTKIEVTDSLGGYQSYVEDSVYLDVVFPDGTYATSLENTFKAVVSPDGRTVTFSYDWSNLEPTYPAGTKFVLKYQTEITGLPESGTIENFTPWGSDATYWGSFSGTKVSTDGTPLAGAQFTLYDGKCNAEPLGDQVGGIIISDSNGKFSSEQLYVATGTDHASDTKDYCLIETKAPAGFVLPDDAQWDIKLSAGTHDLAKVATGSFNENGSIVNTPVDGPELPVTGASGTMLMTVGGIALVAVAGGLFMVTRRKADQK